MAVMEIETKIKDAALEPVVVDPIAMPMQPQPGSSFPGPRVVNDVPIEGVDIAEENAQIAADQFEQEHVRKQLLERGKEVADEQTVMDMLQKLPGQAMDLVTRGLRAAPGEIIDFIPNVSRGVVGGITEMVNSLVDVSSMFPVVPGSPLSGFAISEWVAKQMGATIKPDPEQAKSAVAEKSETGAGQAVESISQFLTGFIPAYKAAKGVQVLQHAGKVGNEVMTEVAAGAFSGAFSMSPTQANLTKTLIDNFPEIKNPVTEWLATDKDSTDMENRAKNAVEEAILGPVGIAVFNTLRSAKAMLKSGGHKNLEAVAKSDAARHQKLTADLKISLGDDAPDAPLVSLQPNVPSTAGISATPQDFVFADKKALFDSDELLNALHFYKGTGYHGLNKTLREIQANPQADPDEIIRATLGEDPEKFKRTVQALDELTQRDASLDETLLRAQNIDVDQLALLEPGTQFHTESFMSTTRRIEVASDFIDTSIKRRSGESQEAVIFEIQSVRGGKVLDMPKNMPGDHEREVLFGRGSVFEVMEVRDMSLFGTKIIKLRYKPDIEPRQTMAFGKLAEVPEVALNINLTKIDTTDDIKLALVKTEELLRTEFKMIRNTHLGEKAIQSLSDATGVQVSELIAKHGDMLPERAVALRTLLASSAGNLIKRAKSASISNNPADIVAFRKAFAVHSAIQAEAVGQAARAGRLLRSFRTPVKENAALARQLDELIMQNGGADFSKAAAIAVADLDVRALMRGGGPELRTTGQKAWDMMMEWWINSLLSAPATQAVNIMSNSATAIWSIPENAVATAVSEGVGAAAHTTGARMFGMVHGLKDGLAMMHHAFRTEGIPDGLRTKIDINRVPQAITMEGDSWLAMGVRGFGHAVRIPGNALVSEDILFKSIGYRMKMYDEAALMAHQEGLRGKAWATRVNQLVTNPSEELRMAATTEADYLTFTSQPGDVARAITTLRNKHPVLKIFAPFVNTPANILRYTFERTPLAPLMKGYREAIQQGGKAAATARTRMAMGTGLMMVFANEAASGNITGSAPADAALAKIWLKDNQPYSIKIGDKWVQYSRLDPIGFLVGFAADFAQIAGYLDDGQSGEIVAAATMSAMGNFTDKTYLAGLAFLNSLLGLSEGSVNLDMASISRNFRQLGSSFLVPRGVAQVARALNEERISTRDETQSFVDHLMNQVRSEIPGWGEGMPVDHNIAGEPILPSHGMGPENISTVYNAVTPFRTKEMKFDPISKMLLDNRIGIDYPDRTINGVKLTEHQYQFLKAARGRHLWDMLGSVMNDVDFKDAPPHIKEVAVRKAVMQAGKIAKALLIEEYPDLPMRLGQKKAFGIDMEPSEAERR